MRSSPSHAAPYSARSPLHRAMVFGLSWTCLSAATQCVAQQVDILSEAYVQKIHKAAKEQRALTNHSAEYEIPHDFQLPPEYQFEQAFEVGPRCGPNALFVLLRLLRVGCTYDDVIAKVETRADGASLAELQRVATLYGVRTEMRQNVAPEDLDKMPMPAILHVDVPGNAGTQHHFIVLCRVDGDGSYSAVETTSCNLVSYSKSRLARIMTGYVLLAPSAPSMMTSLNGVSRAKVGPLHVAFLVLAGVIVANAIVAVARRKQKPSGPMER